MAEGNLSLFGWPMPEPRDKAGRPEHVPTVENRNKIMLLLALKKSNADIAKAIGISQPTLRKHYLQELDQRRVARLQLDATRWAKLYERAVVDGEVSALKELAKVLEKHDLAELDERVQARGKRAPREVAKGKKEQQADAAGTLQGKYAPPAGPGQLVN